MKTGRRGRGAQEVTLTAPTAPIGSQGTWDQSPLCYQSSGPSWPGRFPRGAMWQGTAHSPIPTLPPTLASCSPTPHRLCSSARRNRPSLLVEIHTHSLAKLSAGRRGEEGGAAVGTGGSTREWTDRDGAHL